MYISIHVYICTHACILVLKMWHMYANAIERAVAGAIACAVHIGAVCVKLSCLVIQHVLMILFEVAHFPQDLADMQWKHRLTRTCVTPHGVILRCNDDRMSS